MKNKHRKEQIQKLGTSPGTLVYTGHMTNDTDVQCISYTPEDVQVRTYAVAQDTLDTKRHNWLIVTGLSDTESMKTIGKAFGLHSLVLEDILHVNQRPKVEVLDNGVFVVLQWFDWKRGELQKEQLSFVLMPHCLLSFAEEADNPLRTIEERMHDATKRVRKHGGEYLLHSILDLVVDQYFLVLHSAEERLETMNENIMQKDGWEMLQDLHAIKTELLLLRKNIAPLADFPLSLKEYYVGKDKVYWQDLKDHITQAQENVKSNLEIVESLLDLYFSLVGLRTNKIMQKLTVITLVFLPLSLLAGIYGMNFAHMPELSWAWGYPILIGLMLLVAVLILWYFKRKKWF